jgi:prophage tail gpP-like protein
MSDNIIKLVIGSDEFKFWSSFEITRNIDTFDTFRFDAPFDENAGIRDAIKPLQFKSGQIFIDDKLVSTVTIVNALPTLGSESNSISVDGYAKPGVLNDCSVRHSDYPLEFDGQTLAQIATTLSGFYGVGTFFTESSGAPFVKARLEVGQDPFDFLIKLARDRGFLISSTALGKILFRKAAVNPKSTTLKQGHTPLLSVTPKINPQIYRSEITGLSPGNGEETTINNTNLDVLRPLVYKLKQEQSGADLQNAVRWKMGMMFANAISYSIAVQGLRDERGDIWETNTYINLTAPGAFIDNETKFIIKNLTLAKTDSETTTMNLVLPESYTGEIPKRLPWD